MTTAVLAQVFSSEFCVIFKNTFLAEQLRVTAYVATTITACFSFLESDYQKQTILELIIEMCWLVVLGMSIYRLNTISLCFELWKN